MAARTGAGVGVGVTITLLGVVCLTLFILTIVFLSKYQATSKNLTVALQENEDFIKSSERGNDAIQRLKEAATRERKSVVGYLNDSLATTKQRVTGSKGGSIEDFLGKLEVDGGTPLLTAIRNRDNQIADLEQKLQQADEARQTALTDLENEVQRVSNLEKSHQQTIAALNEQIANYRAEIESYRQGTNDYRANVDEILEKMRTEAEEERIRLTNRINELQQRELILTSQVQELRKDRGKDILKPQDEFALVDGTIVAAEPNAEQVFIDLGERNRIRLGMTFAVYGEPTAIKLDPTTGEYSRPKARLEVINVGERSSACRVISETRGNPIVKGDVIANAVYDPNKIYTFLVYGNFDANGDGRATPLEQADVRALIESWGGKVTDELTGSVDFLVLGQRPILPPAPTSETPIELVREYMRLNGMVEEYNRLQTQANATSLPILNENRLYTLIGARTVAARR